MKALIKCPKCNGPLLSNYYPSLDRGDYCIKACINYLDHKFKLQTIRGNDDEIDIIEIDVCNMQVRWFLLEKQLVLQKLSYPGYVSRKGIHIEFFYPDLSDYDKLIDKIETYMLLL